MTPAPQPRSLLFAEASLVALAAALVGWLCLGADVFTIDSYYYLSKAKTLGHGEWLRVPWNDGIDRKFFWGYSLALALPLRLFGEAGWWLLQVGLVAGTGALFARILRRLPLSPAGRTGALALALFNPVALWWSTIPMSEALLVALSAGAVLEALRWREQGRARELFLAALLGGLAFLTRVEGAFMGLALLGLCGPRLLRERRHAQLATCAAIFFLPEALHVAYLTAHALESKGLIAYLDEARGHFAEFHFFDAMWRHVRAPYWMIFRFDTEPWLYARFFPAWFTTLQGAVLVLYLLSAVAALATGIFRPGYAFVAAAAIVAFALLHSLWYYAYERYDYLIYPLAALVLAWGVDRAFSWTPARVRSAGVLAVALLLSAISGAYGARVSQMHAERLRLHQGGRDYRGVAKVVNSANPAGRPVVTDLGPYLAFYLSGHSYFNRIERDFYDDVAPSGEGGRIFLAQKQIAAIASTRPASEVVTEFALVPGEYHLLESRGASVVAIDLPIGP